MYYNVFHLVPEKDEKLFNIFEVGGDIKALLDAFIKGDYFEVFKIMISIKKEMGNMTMQEKDLISIIEKVMAVVDCIINIFGDDIPSIFRRKLLDTNV